MPSTCVVGLQWGDEAKGKIVDALCDRHDMVVRYQGGANAGHTVVTGGVTYKLSLLPSGILRDGITSVLGNGLVIHPPTLLEEIERLAGQGIDVSGRLLVGDRAHVIMPYHLVEERLTEESTEAAEQLGTTRRGIGPCYRDKVGRVHGIRIADLYYPDSFREQVRRAVEFKNRSLSALLPSFTPLDARAITEEYLALADRMEPYVGDATDRLHREIESGSRLLFEGAQGTLLDIDHGSYPYVTSSNSSAAGIWSGSGVPARFVDRWIGVVKAYTTRVGEGPFPTELHDETGERIRRVGREFGTVTGRPRRCGWFDAVAGRYTARVSGSTELAVMLLDVLSGIDRLRVAVAYEDESGARVSAFPAHLDRLAQCRPVFHELPGWSEDISGVRSWADLPENARRYVQFLGEQVGVPVRIVSVGPDRDQTIWLDSATDRT
ncbi:adenylosuccinate synthase [Tautonia sp. JC769]|uniref:adenylosuccinate synthase n=1 Tax=Tautonia sp. JC769 TaxID=3232135 RepID=UPI00345941AA